MTISTGRREFLQATSLACVGALTHMGAGSGAVGPKETKTPQIENQSFRVTFDPISGELNAWRKDGRPFLSRAVSRVQGPAESRSTADQGFRRTVTATKVQDRLGTGTQLLALCKDANRLIEIEMRVTLYEGRNALILECICRNESDNASLALHSIEPVKASFDEGGRFHWGPVRKMLRNGYMYYDAGSLEDFSEQPGHSVQSMWNAAFYNGDREEGLVVGFLENNVAEGSVVAVPYPGQEREAGFSLITNSRYNLGFVLKPGTEVSSGRVIFNLAGDPFTALESYAQAVGDAHQVKLNPIINGWCPWFYGKGRISEAEVLRNAEFISKHMKPYGMEWIQIDAGYQRALGTLETNALFPHGMKWLAERIRDLGLRPGIWISPYVISKDTEVARNHPDWLVHDASGNLQKPFALDVTHQDARQWLYQMFKTLAQDWGYDFIKIDFVGWTLLAAEHFHDPSMSKAQAYRLGFETMRSAIGPDRHLLDCGPPQITVGLLDSTRIELDRSFLTWAHYVRFPTNSNAPAAAKRYYFHKRTWINDDDHLGLANLTIPQAQAAASIIALSGGTMICGDRMFELDPARLEILKKVFPAYGEAARPVDLFDCDNPEIFVLPIKTKFAQWTLLAIFNYAETAAAERRVSIERVRLNPLATYVAYDFWGQRFHALVRDEISTWLPPSSVAVFALHEKRGVPQVVSTDRHFTQGALELENVEWDASASGLSGRSLGPLGTAHNVAIYIPEDYLWARGEKSLQQSRKIDLPRVGLDSSWRDNIPYDFEDYDGYTLKLVEPNILRVLVRFEDSPGRTWQANFRKRPA